MDKKKLEHIFDAILIPGGFKKKSSTWYRQNEDLLQIISLQKSSWGMQFYVNIACAPNKMEVDGFPFPKENKCPIRLRLDAIAPNSNGEIDSFFDLEMSNINDSERSEFINQLIQNNILPFLNNYMNDIISLRQGIEQGVFKRALIELSAQKYLGTINGL